jgi:dienelactone hydrolase
VQLGTEKSKEKELKMGIIIFLIAVIVEITFAAFCIITKSNHVKERSIIRIAAFAGFVLLAVLPIIDWSFRYYALASLLLLLSIIGAKNLIQQKEEIREYKAVRVVLKAVGMTVLIFALTLPAIIFPQNKAVVAATGEYQVLTQTYTYTDKSRIESYTDTGKNRKLNVQFWHPDNFGKTYPLIVFSHGGLGVKSSNESLYNELASQGYVVCSIDHTYQCLYTTGEGGDTTLIDLGYMKELSAEDPQSDIQQSYGYYQKWMKIRTDDINFVIDYIITEVENSNADMEYKLVDIAKIGVMGHSLGGSAALGIGRMRDDVNAVIALESPFMYDIEGIEDDRFIFTGKIYPVPVLNVYSDSSWNILGERPQYAANYRMLLDNDATAFNVYISGVGHLALTDFALTSPFLTRISDRKKLTTEKTVYCLKTINKVCLEFFNSYLKEEGGFTSSGPY